MNREISIQVNARHISQLGRELVTDYVTALTELVKNSYDADSEIVELIFDNTRSGMGSIIIADTGSGFTADDIEKKWAVIGTNNKVKNPYSPKFNRRCVGKKGIGRYSVERLAEYCTIYSFSEKGEPIKYFTNWNKYEGIDLNELRQRVEILKNNLDFESAKYIKRIIEYLLLNRNVEEQHKRTIREDVLLNNDLAYPLFYKEEIIKNIEEYLFPICTDYIDLEEKVSEVKNIVEELKGEELEYFYNKLVDLYSRNDECNCTPPYTGTFIVLDNLRDEWRLEDIEKVNKEFRLLISPFKEKNNFSLYISAPEYNLYEVKLENNILKQRYAKVDAKLVSCKEKGSGNTSLFSARYKDANGVELNFNDTLENYICGDLEITIYYFLRDKSLKFEGLKVKEAKEVLDAFCGVKIYRDGFRVRPYGEEGNDWLLLDRTKIKDPHSYRVGNNQVIGEVSINSDDNPLLVDATNREAIIENDAFNQLKEIVKRCIRIIEQHRYDEYLKEKNQSLISKEEDERRNEKIAIKRKINEKKSELNTALMQGNRKNAGKIVEDIIKTVSEDQKQERIHYERTKKEYEAKLKDSNNELQLYKNLAALGILAGSFGHETDDSIARILLNIEYPKTRLMELLPDDKDIKNAFIDLDDDIYRISCYSDLLIAFLKKRKRSERELLSFKKIIEEIIGYYRVLVNEYLIEIDTSEVEEFECKIPMKQIDIESIIVNLLTNSFEALKGVKGDRIINISSLFQNNEYIIKVEDTGKGVEENLRKWIFMPLNTTKEDDGVGLGLTIVKDIVESYSGKIIVNKSERLGGAQFTVSFPLSEVECE